MNFDANSSWTRKNNRAGGSSGSLLDYVFISEELKGIASNVVINHFSDNLSNHEPVCADFHLYLTDTVTKKFAYPPAGINWQNIDGDLSRQYADLMKDGLDSIHVPFHSLLHGIPQKFTDQSRD